MGGLIIVVVLLLAIILFDLAAWFWGVDSTLTFANPERGPRARRETDPAWLAYPDT